MKTRVFVRGLLVIGLVGLFCGYVLAAEQSTRSDRETTQQTQQQTQQQRQQTMRQGAAAQQAATLQRTSKLIGKDVKNTENEDVGSIYDLVLTSDHQQISYAALSHGGTWGFGAKYFAVPWSAFQVGPQGDLILPVSRNHLEQASGFDRNNWPAQADTQWLTSTRQGQISGRSSPQTGARQGTTDTGPATDRQSAQSGTQRQSTTRDADSDRPMTARTETDTGYGATATSRDIEHRRVSNLTGTTVTNAEGDDIGNIEDFVIDARRGQVAYTIVSFGGFWGIGEKYSAVPASAIQLNPRRNTARLDADRETLESIAFDSDEFPDLSNQQYAQRLHETFNAEPYWTVMGFVSPEQEQAAANGRGDRRASSPGTSIPRTSRPSRERSRAWVRSSRKGRLRAPREDCACGSRRMTAIW